MKKEFKLKKINYKPIFNIKSIPFSNPPHNNSAKRSKASKGNRPSC